KKLDNNIAAFIIEDLQLFSVLQSQAFKGIIEDRLKEILINAKDKILQNIRKYALDSAEIIDNRSNIKLCLEKLGRRYNMFKIFCFGYTLQLTINDALKECLAITNLIKKYKDIVSHLAEARFLLEAQMEIDDWDKLFSIVCDVLM
ncbi:1750_t:CDS:2, partial [Racocetra fulgida]